MSNEEFRFLDRAPGYLIGSHGTIIGRRGKVLAGGIRRGYRVVLIYDGSSIEGRRSVSVHSLVCEAFHGPKPSPKHHAAHKDGNRLNNRSDNLRWLTPRENILEKIVHGTMNYGQRNGRAKLTPDQVRQIRKSVAAGRPHRELAEKYGVALSNIHFIVTRKTWSTLSDD